MKKSIYYIFAIFIFASCSESNSNLNSVDKIPLSNNINYSELNGDLIYIGDTLSLNIDSNCLNHFTTDIYDVLNENTYFEVNQVNEIKFAKNNLLKVIYTTSKKQYFEDNGESGYKATLKSISSQSTYYRVLKYILKGDTLELPKTLDEDIRPSKYKINIQGDSIVYLKLILSSDELYKRRERINKYLNERDYYMKKYYNDYYKPNCINQELLDYLTNNTITHSFLKLNYE
jgi:hypothetical protein